jgi:hypothetical protein
MTGQLVSYHFIINYITPPFLAPNVTPVYAAPLKRLGLPFARSSHYAQKHRKQPEHYA